MVKLSTTDCKNIIKGEAGELITFGGAIPGAVKAYDFNKPLDLNSVKTKTSKSCSLTGPKKALAEFWYEQHSNSFSTTWTGHSNPKLAQGPTSGIGTGTDAAPQGQALGAVKEATGVDMFGMGVSQHAAQGMFTQDSRCAKNDETRTSI